MNARLVRLVPLAGALSLALLASCGDKEAGSALLSDLDEGMSRQEMLAKIGQGPLSATGNDTLRVVNGFRHMRFFQNGKTYEVVFVREEPGAVTDAVVKERETPIVLQDDKVIGWGWKYYGSEAMEKLKLPNPLTPVYDSASAKPRPLPVGAAETPTPPPSDTGRKQ